MKRNKQARRQSILRVYLLIVFALTIFLGLTDSVLAQGQWTTDGNNISNTNTGNVGIGTSTPAALLSLQKDQAAGTEIRIGNNNAAGFSGLYLNGGFTHTSGGFIQWNNASGLNNLFVGTGGANPLYLGTENSIRFTILPTSGNVGIGSTAPTSRTHIYTNTASTGGTGDYTNEANNILTLESGATALFPRVIHRAASPSVAAVYSFQTGKDAYWGEAGDTGKYRFRGRDLIVENGNVGVGTTSPTTKLHVAGNIKATGDLIVDGNIAAKYQDVAEWVPSSQKLAAGTVVILDTEQANQVIASTRAYDTKVAGVVSAQPGVILGEAGENKAMVATTGRVKVKVDARRAPIKVGDLLVTSDVEGVAMKSVPLELDGTPIHRPGTLIGKALEPLEKGTGEILVLLSLQ